MKNWVNILKLFALLAVFAPLAAFAGGPHTAYGTLIYSDNTHPASATVTAYLKKNPSNVLSGTYNASSGQWIVQCGNFAVVWNAGDILHADFRDGQGITASAEVTLTDDAADDAGTTTLSRSVRQVIIATSPSGRDFQVDGTTYNSSHTFSWDQGSTHTLATTSPQSAGSGVRYVYVSWSDGGAQSHSFTVPDHNETITATFKKQYYLTVASAHGNPQGQGWYDEGATASFSVTSPHVQGQTRYLFQNWSGDYSGSSPSGSVVMNAAKSVTANWQTQHFLDINSARGSTSGEGWYNAGSSATFTLSSGTVSGGAGAQYIFTGWSGSGTGSYSGSGLSHSVVMNNPITETANWKTQYYLDVLSARGSITGNGWYDAGVAATFSISPTTIAGDPGARYVFTGWSGSGAGSYIGPNASQSVTMNNPITETANWKTQYQLTVNSTNGNPTGAGWHDAGASAAFSVTSPDVQGSTRYVFVNWTGDYAGTNPSGTISMNSAKTVTANWKTQYYLTVESSRGNPAGQGWYDAGATAGFSVTSPDVQGQTRYIFVNWTGDFSGTSTSGSVVMSQAKRVTANWRTEYFLTTAVSPSAAGTISPSAPGQWYAAGATANFSTTASAGYQFKNWSGSYSGTSPSGSLVMNAPKSVTANYDKISQITINTTPAGLTYRVDGVEYNSSRVFTWIEAGSHELSAPSPQTNVTTIFLFSNWSDGGTQTHNYIVPENDQTVIATFTEKSDAKLTMQVNSASWGSTVPSVGEHVYQLGQVITIKATPSQGYAFLRWEGAVENAQSPQTTVTMSSDKTVKAVFGQSDYTLNISALPTGTGSTDPAVGSHSYKSWTSVALTALPAQGYRFDKWTGDVNDPDSTTTFIVMSGNKNVAANFLPLGAAMDTLEVKINPLNGGSTSPTAGLHAFAHGSIIQLSATPAQGFKFKNWSGAVANPESAQTTITMNGRQVVTANFVEMAPVRINTSVAGLAVQVDGSIFTAPADFLWEKGSKHTIATASPQSLAENTRYLYLSWSDDGAQSHEITVGSVQEYRADFRTEHYLATLESPDEGGAVVPAPPGAWIKKDSVVVVQATANAAGGYVFEKWSGDLNGAVNPTTMQMSSPKKITAHFIKMFPITITSDPLNLPVTIDGVNYRTPQTFTWADQSTHTLSIQDTLSSGDGIRHVFKSWSDAGASTHVITVTAAKTLTASMETQFFLRTLASPADGGTVIPPAPGAWFQKDATATLSALANAANSYVFSGWSGDLSSTANPATLLMDAPKSVIANFVQKGKIQITSFPEGLDIIVDGQRHTTPRLFDWQKGSKHTISAPDSQVQNVSTRHLFVSWNDGGAQTHEIVVSDAALYSANFTTQYFVATLKTPEDGGELLPVSIPGWFNKGTQIAVGAVANDSSGYIFSEWKGDLSGKENPILLRVDAPKTVHAVFAKKTFLLKIIMNPPNAGQVKQTPAKPTYAHNELVRLQAVPQRNYRFLGWYGDATGTSDTLSVLMNKEKTIIALFINVDLSAPRLTYCDPAAGETAAPRNSIIRFDLEDQDSGVDLNSLFFSVNDSIIFLDGRDQTFGRAFIHYEDSSVAVQYDPSAPFFKGEKISVRIQCRDLALLANQIDTSYSYNVGLSKLTGQKHYAADSSGGEFYDDSTGLRIIASPKQIAGATQIVVGKMDSIPADYLYPISFSTIYYCTARSNGHNDSVIVQLPFKANDLTDAGVSSPDQLGVLGFSTRLGEWFRYKINRAVDNYLVLTVKEPGYLAIAANPEIISNLGMISGPASAFIDSTHRFDHPKISSTWSSMFIYRFNWGDSSNAFWLDEPADFHSWEKAGKYPVTMNAQNILDPAKTHVSDTLWVEILPKTKIDKKDDLPASLTILQNYPNPFNPTTTIEFSLPKPVKVKLTVFDILGREILILLDKEMESGSYLAKFDATNIDSGVYFYSLQAGDQVFTKKMLIVK